MKSPIPHLRLRRGLLLSLSLGGWLTAGVATQTWAPEDFFHDGALNYLSNNIPNALAVVTNGRARFPDDRKLQQLEELLKQQNPQSQSQSESSPSEAAQPPDQSPPEEQPDASPSQTSPEQSPEQPPPEQAPEKTPSVAPGQMTPDEARRLLDGQKDEEQVLQFRPEQNPRDPNRPFRDW